MDALLSRQYSSNIPHTIYHPLLQIARHGYDAEDIKFWYSTITAQLFGPAAHTPNSASTVPHLQDLEGSVSDSIHATAIESNGDLQHSFENPAANVGGWGVTFPFSDFTPDQMSVTTALGTQPTYAPTTDADIKSSPCWSQQASPYPSNTAFNIPTPVSDSAVFMSDEAKFSPWTCSEPTDNGVDYTRKRRASHTPPYQISMSSTAMPLLIPTPEMPLPTQSALFHSTPASTEVTYLPPISIIPARKRRKGGSKGVQKFIQPLHVSRPSI